MRLSGFHRFWCGNAVSMLGDQVSLVAIPLVAVTTLQASPAQLGLLVAVSGMPLLLFGLPVGAWVDRMPRRRLLIAADLARAVIVGTVPAAALVDGLGFALLLGVGFVAASMAVVFNLAASAFLPSLLPPDRLVAGNARLTQTRAVAQIAGPGFAGILVQALTAPIAVAVDALSYLVSAFFVGRIDARDAPPPTRQRLDRDIRSGLTLVWRDRLLRASALSAGTYTFFNAAILALLVLYLARELHFSPAQIGLVLAAAGPGGLLGAAFAVRASNRFGIGPTMIAGLAVAGSANLALSLAAGPAVIGAAMLVNGAAQPL